MLTRFGSQLFSKRHTSKERDNSEKVIIAGEGHLSGLRGAD